MVSVLPNTIVQSISARYKIVFHSLIEWDTIKLDLADNANTLSPTWNTLWSFCLMFNIMIDIRHVSRCVIQIFKPVRFILHALSLDYISSSVHVKNLPPTAPQEDACPRGRSERLPLNIHRTVMTTRAVPPLRVAQKAALTTIQGGNCIYTKCHTYSQIMAIRGNYSRIRGKYWQIRL